MDITFPVNLTPAEEAALGAIASARGLSIESRLHEAVLQLITSDQSEPDAALSCDQWETELMEWFDSIPDVPPLSDEALSRENIYTREDEWR
jgi:hypothetical protein